MRFFSTLILLLAVIGFPLIWTLNLFGLSFNDGTKKGVNREIAACIYAGVVTLIGIVVTLYQVCGILLK